MKLVNVEKGNRDGQAKVTDDSGRIISLPGCQRIDVDPVNDIIKIVDNYGEVHELEFSEATLNKQGQTDAESLVDYWFDNGFFLSSGGGGGRQYQYIFPDNTARDNFFNGLSTPIAELQAFQTFILVGDAEEQIWEGASDPASYVNTNWRVTVANTIFMQRSVYDPTSINASPFQRVNHTGTQTQSTVTDLVNDLAAKAAVTTVPKSFQRALSATDVSNGYITLPENASGIFDISLEGLSLFDFTTKGIVIDGANANRLLLPDNPSFKATGLEYIIKYFAQS